MKHFLTNFRAAEKTDVYVSDESEMIMEHESGNANGFLLTDIYKHCSNKNKGN